MSQSVDPDRFCYYPFMQLLLQPTGTVSPCCWNQEIALGRIPEQSLRDIWNGDKLRELRREFLDGNPQMCSRQMRDIRCHVWSRRDFAGLLDLAEIQPRGPARLDVRLNGRCNLKCVMCDVWRQPNGLYDGSDFWAKGPGEIFPQLLEIDVLGGEPFVQSDTFRLMDEVSAVNRRCTWAFVTNGSYRFGDAIRRRLDKLSIRWIQVSLDSVDPITYAAIRVDGELETALATLDGLEDYRARRAAEGRGFDLLVTTCVQKLNWSEIGDFLAFAGRRKLKPVLQFAYEPATVSLLSSPLGERESMVRFLESLIPRFGAAAVHSVLSPLRESLAVR
ncbi:MAG: SPASM domain-containing protein [Elusimicrobiota bacterium]